MKKKYLSPLSEYCESLSCERVLMESELVDFYTGEDAVPADGTW